MMKRRAMLRLVSAWGALFLAPVAWAHAKLVRSEPAARSILSVPPRQLRLWFSERIEVAFSALEVRDAAARVVATDKAIVDARDPKLMQVVLPVLQDGVYTVRYRVLSVDGHVIEGDFRFTVRGPAS